MTELRFNAEQTDPQGLIACPECDLLIRQTHTGPGVKCFCPRCRCIVSHAKKDTVKRTLILSLTGLILFIPAMILPIMTLDTFGLEQSANIIQGARALFLSGFHMVGIIVMLTAVIIPLLKLLFMFYVSLAIRMGAHPKNLAFTFRVYQRMDEWGMLEICMLGILISIIKLKDLAEISYGTGLFCFAALLIITLVSSVTLDERKYWSLIQR